MSDIPQTLGPVAKLQFLAQAAAMPNLSRVKLAVLVVLTDMANATHGLAWPSFSTLAARTGTTTRHAKTAIKGLIAAGLIVVHQQGNRIRSNRYRLNQKPPENAQGSDPQDTTQGSDPQDTTQGSDLQDTRVVIPSDLSGALQSTKVVNPRAPESIHQSEPKAKIDDRATGEGAAAPFRPVGPSGLHPPEPITNQDGYPDFWQAMPMKTTVAAAEARITEYLANGVIYTEIVAGAKRYSAYCQATTSPRRQSALAWLDRQAWRDDWTAPTTKRPASATDSPQEARKAEGKASTPAKTKDAKKVNPEYLTWDAEMKKMYTQRNQESEFLDHWADRAPGRSHNLKCKKCFDAFQATGYGFKPISLIDCCGEGRPLAKEANRLRQVRIDHENKKPKQYLPRH